MTYELNILLATVVAMVTSALVFPRALKFAKKHNIVDNPDARKLQRVPVPVFGGMVVFTGILMGGLVLCNFMWNRVMMNTMVAMTVMMIIGTWDDISNLSARFRFFCGNTAGVSFHVVHRCLYRQPAWLMGRVCSLSLD